jgi:hypothetical protein
VVKVRDGHQVRNKAAHLAVGVDLDGVRHVLGIWVQAAEGAKFWAGVCAELRNRGVRDVLIVCCDGLTGFPEAIEATWPQATVQTCTVHLIRAAMRFVSYQDRKKVAAALRPIYTAPTVEAAETELLAFAESDLGRRYPAAVVTWENAWERFIPFLAFPPELRKIIYTTDEIVNPLLGRGLLWDPFFCSPAAQPEGVGPQPGSRWSARSAARTNDLDPGEDRRSVRWRWAWSDPVAKSRVWGCQPCRAASPREGLESRAPVVAATSTPDLACP